jgi:hypothetical protein
VLDEGVAKDRAAPFSRKHAKYWFTVTGGMILIGLLNVGLGWWLYEPPGDPPERLIPTQAPGPGPGSEGEIGLGEIPVPVMRSFAQNFPRRAPQAARKLGNDIYELTFAPPGSTLSEKARFRADGTLIQ